MVVVTQTTKSFARHICRTQRPRYGLAGLLTSLICTFSKHELTVQSPEALAATASSRSRTDVEPAKAMAISPVAKIRLIMVFALSQRSNVRWSSADMYLYIRTMSPLPILPSSRCDLHPTIIRVPFFLTDPLRPVTLMQAEISSKARLNCALAP